MTSRCVLPLLLLAWASSAGVVRAGALDPAHAFERVGATPGEIAAVAPVGGRGRLLVFQKTGEIHLVTGDGLLAELVTTLPVHGGCAVGGALDAVFNPAAPATDLFASYLDAASERLTVARLTLDGSRLVATDVIHEVTAGPACTEIGGGLAFDSTGRLLLGVGDHGQSGQVPNPASPVGKLLRLEPDGSVPADSPTGSLRHAGGLRDPIRIATDSVSGDSWFLDRGPGDNDEVNLVVADADYGWPTAAGRLELPGLTDPAQVWSPAASPSGLVAYRGDDLPPAENGDLLVTLGDGSLVQLREPLAPLGATEERVLYSPAVGEPDAFADLVLGTDAHVYLGEVAGGAHRFLRKGAEPVLEPSRRASVVPLTVSKTGDTITLGIERSSGTEDYGLYVGSLGSGLPNHPDETDLYYPVDTNASDATARFDVDAGELRTRGGDAAYLLVSARGVVDETGLGEESDGSGRTGGDNDRIPACELPCEGPVGRNDGDCAPSFTLAEGVEGSGNVIGPAAFFADYTCRVILIHIGAEW